VVEWPAGIRSPRPLTTDVIPRLDQGCGDHELQEAPTTERSRGLQAVQAWKVNGYRTEREGGETSSDDRRRKADEEIRAYETRA